MPSPVRRICSGDRRLPRGESLPACLLPRAGCLDSYRTPSGPLLLLVQRYGRASVHPYLCGMPPAAPYGDRNGVELFRHCCVYGGYHRNLHLKDSSKASSSSSAGTSFRFDKYYALDGFPRPKDRRYIVERGCARGQHLELCDDGLVESKCRRRLLLL